MDEATLPFFDLLMTIELSLLTLSMRLALNVIEKKTPNAPRRPDRPMMLEMSCKRVTFSERVVDAK